MMKPVLEIYDLDDVQYRPAARGAKLTRGWQGGEDLTLDAVLDRSSSRDWPDIGYDHKVIVRQGLEAIWEGRLRGIDQGVEEIKIIAVGNSILLGDFPYIGGTDAGTHGRLWCDTRYGMWKPTNEDLNSNRTPKRYEFDLQNRLWIGPREGEYCSSSERGGVYYQCLYDDIKRVTFTAAVGTFTGWDAVLRAWHTDWSTGENLWTYSVDGVGAKDITLTTERPILEFLIWPTTGATFTGNTGDTYLKITALEIFGTTDTSPTVTDVAGDIVDQLQAGTDIVNDKTEIATIALTLKPLIYENNETCLAALEDAAGFGDASNKPLAWGIESGSTRAFVREPDRDSVRYIVPPLQARKLSAKGETFENYYSAATGVYLDEEGVRQYTDTYYAHVTGAGIVANTTSTGDDLSSEVYGVKRETHVSFGRVGSALATDFIKAFVVEHGKPMVTSSFEVYGPIQDLRQGGAWIEAFRAEMGYLVQIPWFRATEAEGSSGDDLTDADTTFLLVGLEHDLESGVTKLIPEGAKDDLQRLMEFSRRFREGEEASAMEHHGGALGM